MRAAEPAAVQAPAVPTPDAPDANGPARRDFFRLFAGDLMASFGSVMGAAQALQQQSADAARELLGTTTVPLPGAPAGGVPDQRPVAVEQPAAGIGFRAPFRWDGGVCHVVDQRRLPDTLAELEVRTAAEAVTAIRDESVVGGPAQAQVAAIAIALQATRSVTSRPFARRAMLRGAGNALRNSRPASAVMVSTIERLMNVLDAFKPEAPGEMIATAIHFEAERIVQEMTDAHGALVEHALEVLPGEAGDQLRVLTIGSTGPMGGGQLGTAASVIIAAHHAGRSVHALVAETRPGFHGSRICAWELREAGVAHAVVSDAAAPGCIAAGDIAAVLVGAERVAANGDVLAISGTYPLAMAAAAAGIPLIVCATTSTIDLGLASGDDAFPEQARPSTVLWAAGTRVAPEGTQARAPVQDRTPASLVTALVTEQGVIHAPLEAGLAAHVEAAATRRAAIRNPFLPVALPEDPQPIVDGEAAVDTSGDAEPPGAEPPGAEPPGAEPPAAATSGDTEPATAPGTDA